MRVLQLLHTRSLTGMSMGFNIFLTACYMIFSLKHNSIPKAMDALLEGKSKSEHTRSGASRSTTSGPCTAALLH